MVEANFLNAVFILGGTILILVMIICVICSNSRQFNNPAINNNSNIEPLQTSAQSYGQPVYSELNSQDIHNFRTRQFEIRQFNNPTINNSYNIELLQTSAQSYERPVYSE